MHRRCHFTISKHFPSNNYELAFQMYMMGHVDQWKHTLFKFYPLHHFHKHLNHVLQSSITESSFKFHSKRVRISHLLTKCRKQKNEETSKAVIQGTVCMPFLYKNRGTVEPWKSFSDAVSLPTANITGNFKSNTVLAKTTTINSKVAMPRIKMKP